MSPVYSSECRGRKKANIRLVYCFSFSYTHVNYSTGSIIMEEMVFLRKSIIIARKSVRFVGSTILYPFVKGGFTG